ncbi:WD40 repeat domain-containing protein [Nocardia sp. NPDC057663]|uniref:WD40 repeat domain-containing protein n=1 Tax=Nocardia sp. NPDC057663 TaxID=3346201 RepID=UPI00367198E9
MTITEPESASPRAIFAQRFAELYAAAGNPTLRRVATATERRMRNTQAGTPSPQRISDWKAGRNVPARFESLLPVVLTLVDLTEKAQRELPRRLADPHEWRRLWQESVTWTAAAGEGDTCPYPGLRAFRAEERALFFGREQATTEFVDLVRATTGIVVLIGVSGAGKSSLLAAGLRPALDLPAAAMTPGTTPTAALAAALTDDLRILIVDQFEELFTLCPDEAERSAFLTALADLTTRPHDPLTVVLALRADFYERCLHHPVLRDSLQHNNYLLGPMSLDEVSRAITGPSAAAGLALEQGLEELVLTELRGLGGHTNADAYDPGTLPLLSHVMAATWQQREGRKLTVAGYRKVGGVAGSVAETAELAWSELSPAQQATAQEMLGSLVTVGQDARDTRRIVDRTELLTRSSDPDGAMESLEVLAASRLIALDADSVQFSHEIVLTAWPRLRGWIEADRVGHLVRQRLESDATEWETAARDPALLYRGTRLDSAGAHARAAASPRARAFLHASERSARLGRHWRAGVGVVVAALLATGVVAFDRSRLADQRTADRDYIELVAAAQRTRSSDPSLSAQLSLAAYRMRPDDSARTQLLNSQDLPLAVTMPMHERGITTLVTRPQDDLLVALDNAGEAIFWNVSDPMQPRRVGADSALRAERLVFVPGTTDAVTDGASGIQLWDLARPESPRLTHTFGTSRRQSISVSPDGTRLAETSTSALTVWDISDRANPTRPVTIALPTGQQQHTVMFSPDGNMLAVGRVAFDAGDSDTVQLWDVRDPAAPRPVGPPITTVPTEHLRKFAFSPNSATMAVATYGSRDAQSAQSSRVELWNIGDPHNPRRYGSPIRVDNDLLNSIAFHEDGNILATSSHMAGRLWNITDPTQPTQAGPALSVSPLRCPDKLPYPCNGGPLSLIFLADEPILAAAGNDGSVRIWSMPRSVLDVVPGAPQRPVFDRAGNRMAVLNGGGEIAVWDTTDPHRPARLSTVPGAPGRSAVALSPDGRTLSVHDRPGRQRLVFDLDDPRQPRPLPAWPAAGAERSVVQDDRMLVAGESLVRLWDVTDRSAPVPLGPPIGTTDAMISTSAITADGARLELVYHNRPDSVQQRYFRQIWNLDDPGHPVLTTEVELDFMVTFQPSRFLPDNRTLVTTGFDSFRLWDSGGPGELAPRSDEIRTDITPIISISAPATGTTLAVSRDDGSTVLWDLADPRTPRRVIGPIGPAEERNRRVVVHPGGESLTILTDNGQLGIWDLGPERVAERICTATGDVLTEPVWRRQVPNVPYRPPCA